MEPAEHVRDWVCGMELVKSQVAGKVVQEGKTYYFCSPICRDKFEDDPERYVAREERISGGMKQKS